MKKIAYLVALISLTFFISACGDNGGTEAISFEYTPLQVVNRGEIHLSEANRLLLHPFDVVLVENGSPLFMTAPAHVYMFGELSFHRFKSFPDGGWAAPEIYAVENATVHWLEAAVSDSGTLYVPVVVNNNGVYDTKVLGMGESGASIIAQRSNAVYLNLFATEHYLILFEPQFTGDTFTYQVSKVCFENHHEVVILSRAFCMESNAGYVIPNICVGNETISAFKVVHEVGGARRFFVETYDFTGELQYAYELEDFEDFLYMPEVGDEDSIFRIFYVGEYIVLQTMHNRIALYRFEHGVLRAVSIPPSFHVLGATSYVGAAKAWESGVLYFWNIFGDYLYVYDTHSRTFNTFDIVQGDRDTELTDFMFDWLQSVHRDNEGNLIFQIRIDYGAYLLWREEMMSRGHVFTGAADFMPGDSVFYFVSATFIY